MDGRFVRHLLVLSLAAAWPMRATAQYGEQPPLDPAEYRSRAGRFVLRVEPSDRDGKGSAQYQLLDGTESRWSGERSFTLFDAQVGDDGLVVGYSYSKGLYTAFDPAGDMRVIVLDPSGRIRWDQTIARRSSRILHEDRGEPYAQGLVLDAEHDRLVVRTIASQDEVWLGFRLSTGEVLPELRPLAMMRHSNLNLWVLDAQPVPGTPLTLVAWGRQEWENNLSGVRFTLVDRVARPVWTMDLASDWGKHRDAESKAVKFAREQGPILATAPQAFTILQAQSETAVSFSVKPAPATAWIVAEASRTPFAVPAGETDWLARYREQPARYLGALTLRNRESDSPLRTVHDFEVDEQGRFGFLRRDPDGTRFVLLDDQGTLLREVRLDPGDLGPEAEPRLAWCGASRWVVVWTRNVPPSSQAFWLDAESGAQTRIQAFGGHWISALAGRRDGGFVVIQRRSSEEGPVVYLASSLASFDATGREQWHVEEGLVVDDDVAVAETGRVAVIGPVKNVVQVFSHDGVLEATINLKTSLGRAPNYPSGISADVGGGFVCDDFGSASPLIRLRASGQLNAALAPRYPDGRSTGRLFRVRSDNRGRLWGTDGEALLRLDDGGAVDRVIGSAPNTRELGEVASVALDAADRVYAVDERTGSVHAFGADGQPARVLPVEPGEVDRQLSLPDVTTASDGRVCVDIGEIGSPRHFCFGRNGKRIPSLEWPARWGRSATPRNRTWWFQADTANFWVEEWTHFELLDPAGRIVRRVEKRSNGRWLRQMVDLIPASDGSVAAVHGGMNSSGWSLDLYEGDGSPRASFDLPIEASRSAAYDGRLIAIWHAGAIVVFDVDRGWGVRFRPSVGDRVLKDLPLFLADKGHELWMFEREGSALHRFGIPSRSDAPHGTP